VKLGFKLMASCLQSMQSPVWVTLTVYFTLVILEMGSQKLFAQPDLVL
jgi:hypothetical protein